MKQSVINVGLLDWGSVDYKECFNHQEKLFNTISNIKNANFQQEQKTDTPNYLILCEHPHVYTLGKSGDEKNLLISDAFLKQINATFYHTTRGGDITYHGPGQLVGYPVLDLDNFGIQIKQYIESIEEVIIRTLGHFGLKGYRVNKAPGVWLDPDNPALTRKICALGVKASRGVTMHGFAFNINTDLNYFAYIHPCGFTDKSVTSLQKELGREVAMQEVRALVQQEFAEVFGVNLKNMEQGE